MNSIMLVGRIVRQPKLIEENEHKCCYITLAINRDFRNSEGIYETDFIDIKVPFPMCNAIVEYCLKGDAIGVRGVVERLPKYKNVRIVAREISLISSSGGKNNE